MKHSSPILLFLFVLALLAACVPQSARNKIKEVVSSSVTSKPEEVAAMAEGIAAFDLPAGFEADYGLRLPGGFTLVGYKSGQNTHLFLMQFAAGSKLSQEDMLKQMQTAAQAQNHQWFGIEMKTIEEKPVSVLGKQTKLTISEGKEGGGSTFQQAVAMFDSKGGPTLMVMAGPAGSFEISQAESFLASVH